MERSDAHQELLEEAAEHASGADANLVLLTLITKDQFDADAETLASIGSIEDVSYDSDTVLDATANDIQEFADETVSDDVEFEAIARAVDDDERADAVLNVAGARDCDHVFVLGRRRSPTGKALFGDVAQQVALNFDGYVTLATN